MGPQPVNMEEWGVTQGIYAAECALGMQGFGSYPYSEFPIVLSHAKKRVDLRPISLHPMITEPTPDELIHINGDFYMTTPERSIIDLLRVYPQSEFVTQALQWMDDYAELRRMADKYGVREILEEEIEYAEEVDEEALYDFKDNKSESCI